MFPLYDENPKSTRPYVTYALIVINFAVFIWEILVTGSITMSNQRAANLFTHYGFVPARFLESLAEGRMDGIFTLFSSMFMHGGIMHILGNMLFLWIFGDNIEDRFGHAKYLFAYILWGFMAAIAHMSWAMMMGGNNLLVPAVGASGAISGVLGSYLVIFPRAKIVTVIFYFFIHTTRISAFYYLIMWFIFQVISAPFGGGVAYLAHIGGFVTGVVFGFGYKGLRGRFRRIKYEHKEREKPIEVYKPLNMEGIISNKYVELLADMPGIDPNTVSIRVSDNIIFIDAISSDGYRKYAGKVIMKVKINSKPESIHYLNGILRVRFMRI